MFYKPDENRYSSMPYRRCGKSGLKLPAVSLGLWHNFGSAALYDNARAMVQTAFDLGITHFDLANNYGPEPGSAEITFGRILKQDLAPFRDELVISSKAGYTMWPGPYGDWGSRKYLIASLHQSLRRMGLDYVDIFYSHRYDPDTPLEETMGALSDMVRQGKALYVGISKYPEDKAREACHILRDLGTPCLIYQGRYNIFNRAVEHDILPLATEQGMGFIGFSPLAQGLLSDKYLNGIPADSRAAHPYGFLKREEVTPDVMKKVKKLTDLATHRGQTLAQMALAWCLRDKAVCSVIVGTSSLAQLQSNVAALNNLSFTDEELWLIGEQGG